MTTQQWGLAASWTVPREGEGVDHGTDHLCHSLDHIWNKASSFQVAGDLTPMRGGWGLGFAQLGEGIAVGEPNSHLSLCEGHQKDRGRQENRGPWSWAERDWSDWIKEKKNPHENNKALDQSAQRSCDIFFIRGFQNSDELSSKLSWGPEQRCVHSVLTLFWTGGLTGWRHEWFYEFRSILYINVFTGSIEFNPSGHIYSWL